MIGKICNMHTLSWLIFGLVGILIFPMAWSYGEHESFKNKITDAELQATIHNDQVFVASNMELTNGCDAVITGYLIKEGTKASLDPVILPKKLSSGIKNLKWTIDDHIPNGDYALSVHVNNQCGLSNGFVELKPIVVTYKGG